MDSRLWGLALKMEKPLEAYEEMRSEWKSLREASKISELSPEQQAWLRST